MEKLISHSWRGNVRELRNVIRRGVLLTNSNIITSIDIPDEINVSQNESNKESNSISEIKNDIEKELILKAIHDAKGNKMQAAKTLNMNERTLYRKIKKLGIN